jgi:hypothetical protein
VTRHHYDNEVHPDNVYGHTLELLRRHVGATRSEAGSPVHLDVACGFGNIAEHVRDELGLDYVGLDLDPEELRALQGRGFEVHDVDLMAGDLLARLRDVVAARRVASITFLDGLEHLVDGSGALTALSALAAEHDAVLVTSVPNVTHLDVATKAVLGQWDYTPSGLLDRTHYQLWSVASLGRAFDRAGLEVVDRYDVELEHSDQHFPEDHVGLSSATSLGAWISAVRADAAPHRFTNQFVWASRATARQPEPAAEPAAQPAAEPDSEEATPFISFLLPTSGERRESLDEALLSLAAQTVTDFEVVVLADATGEVLADLEKALAEHPPTLRDRVRLLPVSGSTAEALNAGLAAARGTYVALSDDVTWFGHWVETAVDAARTFPGRCVRGLVLEQGVTTVEVGGAAGVRAVAAPRRAGGAAFSLREHVTAPLASTYGVAFPRSLSEHLGVRFDERFGTAAVRRHLLRAIELAGVVETDEVVAVHQHPEDTTGSNESEEDLRLLIDEINVNPWLAPVGSATRAVRSVPLEDDGDVSIAEQVRLKDDHIANLERLLEERDARIGRLQVKLRQRTARLEKLRAQTREDGSTEQEDADRGPGRWFRRRS